jgi:hypothetical protein
VLREYRAFSAVSVILGLIYAAYAAFSNSGLYALGTHYLGNDMRSVKLVFVLSALVAGAIIGAPLFLAARLAGINIREKAPNPKADELAEIRKRS